MSVAPPTLVVTLFLAAQQQVPAPARIIVGENIPVSRGRETRPLTEPHLAAHPTDPRVLLAGVIISSRVDSEVFGPRQVCAAYRSSDGGRTWERHDFEIRGCGDPWVGITPDGQAVFTALGTHSAVTQQDGGLLVFHSADGGRTWDEAPVGLGRGHDHQTVAVDATGGKRSGSIYVVSGKGVRADDGKLRWSVFVARSADGGKRFFRPFSFIPSNLNINADVPVVLSDGELVVSYSDFQRNVDEFTREGRLERARSWIIKSTDGGGTFSIPLFATEACGPGWSSLAVDGSSGPYRDRLYLVCMGRDGGTIVLHRSEDRGEKWSDPIRVHQAADTAVPRSHPVIAVNKDGAVAIAWQDGRNGPRPTCREVYFTASLDGGRRFLPEQKVSSLASCPDSTTDGAAFKRWPTGGDYYGLAATSDGLFHVLWSDSRTGGFQLWTATVEVRKP